MNAEWEWCASPDASPVRVSDATGPASDVSSAPSVEGILVELDLSDQSSSNPEGAAQAFTATAFLRLAGGGTALALEGRGFTVGSPGGSVRRGLTENSLRRDALLVVHPDEEVGGDARPWADVAEAARNHGIQVSEADLEQLPVEVNLTSRLREWLHTG